MTSVCIGRIVKPHKTAGQFVCQLFSPLDLTGIAGAADFSSGAHRLSALDSIEVRRPRVAERRCLGIVGVQRFGASAATKQCVLLQCHEWSQREQVLPYCGWEVWAERQFAAACGPGESLYCDLVGAGVFCQAQLLGSVQGLVEGGAQPILELLLAPPFCHKQETLYLPFHQSVIGQVELAAEQPRLEILDLVYFESLLHSEV